MPFLARALAACAFLAAFVAGPSFAAPADNAAILNSFAAPLSAYELAALSAHAPGQGQAALTEPASFAFSTALTPTFALDGGYRIDTAARFSSFEHTVDPMAHSGGFLSLADGGRYGGITYVPAADLRLRLGVSNWIGRLDNVSMDGIVAGLPGLFDTSHVNSVLAGVSWEFNNWVGLGLNAISSFRSGTPLGYGTLAPLAESARTTAVDLSAHIKLGNDWVTTADFAQGFSQLRQRSGAAGMESQAYSITVAKRGVFGEDAVGFSLSRPAPGSVNSFTSVADSADLPPMMLANAKTAAPETDFQLGYVTSFLDGKLALQTNAAYQLNPQGQNGATAVSVLSRAKIKF